MYGQRQSNDHGPRKYVWTGQWSKKRDRLKRTTFGENCGVRGYEHSVFEYAKPKDVSCEGNDKMKKNIWLAVVVAMLLPVIADASSILPGDTWRYFKGTSEPASNWNDLGFDDSAWLEGATGIGYSDDVTYPTVLDDMADGGYASVYVRHTFDVANPSSVTALEFGIQYDDGFIAYINGQEIARSVNMTQSFYAHNDYVGSGHDESLPEEVFLIDAADVSSLVTGENVIAIQLHNARSTGSDACIIPRLTVLDSSAPTAVISADNTNSDEAPFSVNFSGAGSSDDGAIVDYHWDFGDGSAPVSGPSSSVAHTYTEEGRFTATLTVTDDEGFSDADSVSIAVGASTYEGFGTVTRGAEGAPGGYQTYHVTSLANSGAGTLRDAVSQGSRLVVFDVGGTINLSGSLYITEVAYLTIDGSTAPSPGITISLPVDRSFYILGEAHDIIINNIRADGNYIGLGTGDGDVFALDGYYGSGPVYNVIVDHCTFTSAGDGVQDTKGTIRNITYSWNLFKDTDFMGSFSDPGERENISLHHNVYARGGERMPKIENEGGSTTTNFDMVNNIVYGWNTYGVGFRGLQIQPDGWLLELHVTNNWYEPVAGADDAAITISGTGHQVNFEGNVFPPGEMDDVDTSTLPPDIPAWAKVTTYDASTLGDTVVPFVGTHYPTSGEQSLLSEIRSVIGGGQLGALNVSSTSGGSVANPGEGVFTYETGTVASLQATADDNCHFENWTGTAVDAGKVANPSAETTTVTVDGSYTIRANFALDLRTLTVSSTGGGSVTKSPDQASYDHGTSVTLQAVPDTGYSFTNWSGDLTGSTNPVDRLVG
jgi:pectate lyase